MISYWLLVIGYWLLVIGHWSLVIGYWLLVVCCLGFGILDLFWIWDLGFWIFKFAFAKLKKLLIIIDFRRLKLKPFKHSKAK